jgi:hypothetical protein
MASERWNREKAVMDLLKESPHVIGGCELISIALDLENLSEEQLSDIEGWIVFGKKNDVKPDAVASNIMHDLVGLRQEYFNKKLDPDYESGFSPRTSDYAKYKEQAA